MSDRGDLLARLTGAVARATVGSLGDRLCAAFRDLTGATGAALTVWYGEPHRVTLAATDAAAARLEDLQDVIGEGPGHTAWSSGRIETGILPRTESLARWPVFAEAAEEMGDHMVIHAVPMRPWERRFGIATLYRTGPSPGLLLDPAQLSFLADAVGAALIRDALAVEEENASGPWGSRAQVHQATGMVIAQLRVGTEDALALLRAQAFAQNATLAEIAASVVKHRRLDFPVTR
ncbi:ANTAR domain-containing protein [Nocardioides antri]|uniref:ANTAR domain-containing protein n=1 Tax=Nocardioides antri TaxID=2607659 RepID=A0A5B1M9X7_9ACTN|nr:ANTAR domain-containing protein [Nocardioides antri]KAA1428717.1 ANTAR domain-containing protein [Nocardioides antri]